MISIENNQYLFDDIWAMAAIYFRQEIGLQIRGKVLTQISCMLDNTLDEIDSMNWLVIHDYLTEITKPVRNPN